MTEDIDLKTLEKKVYQRFFEDGIWDIFLGIIILNLGLLPLFSSLNVLPNFWNVIIPTLGLNIIAFVIFYLGKKYITVPRIGFVKFGPKRKAKQKKLKLFLFIVLIINLIIFILPFTGITNQIEIERYIIILLLGFGIFTLPFCIMAYLLDFTRLYYYGFSVGIGTFLTESLKSALGYPFSTFVIFGSIGMVILIIGLTFFIRFLKKYPMTKDILRQEVTDG